MNNLPQKKDNRVALISQKFPTIADFALSLAPHEVTKRFLAIKSIEQAMKSKIAKLTEIAEAYGKESAYSYIEAWVIKLNDYVNKNPQMSMNTEQVEETAMFLYQEACFLNLAELSLFFRRVKSGYFGELPGYLDGVRIMSYMRLFLTERSAAWMKAQRQEEGRIKAESFEKMKAIQAGMPEEVKKKLQKKFESTQNWK